MKIALGLIFVLVGVLLIFGLFTGDTLLNALVNLANYWPIILVLVGMSILASIRGLRWIRYLNTILIVAFVLFVFFWPSPFLAGEKAVSNTVVLETSDPATSIEIQLDLAISNISLEPLRDEVASSTVAVVDYAVRGSSLKVEQDTTQLSQRFVMEPESNVSWLGTSTVVMKLNPAYNYVLKFGGAVMNCNFNLGELRIDELRINGAIVKAIVFMSEAGSTNLKVNAAIINSEIHIPENIRSILKASAAIKNVKTDLPYTDNGEFVFEGVSFDFSSYITMESAIINLKVLR
ncbi:MAG: hypothetical protein JW697_01600 [Kosmotogaceae bacterium]|nr:hypothetical protein [Kosmotogaceae bacterium]